MSTDNKEQSDCDQAMAELTESWPTMLHRFYKNCMEQGFTEERAYLLTIQFMQSLMSRSNSAE